MAQTVPLFRLVLAALTAGGVAGYGAVLLAPSLGIDDLADVEPFVASVAGSVTALVAWVLGVVLGVAVLGIVLDGLVTVLVAGYVAAAVGLVPVAAVVARRRLGAEGSAPLVRWVALSTAGFAVVGVVTAGLSALLLWVPPF